MGPGSPHWEDLQHDSINNSQHKLSWLKVRLHAGHVLPREMNGSGWVIKFQRTNSHEQNLQNNQWDRYRIFRSGPRVPGCFNGEIQSFYAESGPFLDHFWNFSELLVIILIVFVHSIDIHHFKIIVIHICI